MNNARRIETNPFPRGISRLQLIQNFTINTLLPRQGSLYVVGRQEIIGARLLDRGIKNILVSQTPNLDTMQNQLAQVLGVRTKPSSAAIPADRSLFFNIPEFLKEGILFTSAKVSQETTDSSGYAKITREQVRKGLTDFGEDVLRFMELNDVVSLQILTELTIPRYRKIGRGGTVSGDRLGMRGDVSRWNTVAIATKENCGCKDFECIIACPHGAISPFSTKVNPIAGGVKTDFTACKGCSQCIPACDKETFWQVKQDE